jgi:hypothetical protein
MLQTLLERRVARRGGDHPRLVCWFNAWEHEDADHLGAALAAAVAREASRHRPLWRRALFPLPSAMLELLTEAPALAGVIERLIYFIPAPAAPTITAATATATSGTR